MTDRWQNPPATVRCWKGELGAVMISGVMVGGRRGTVRRRVRWWTILSGVILAMPVAACTMAPRGMPATTPAPAPPAESFHLAPGQGAVGAVAHYRIRHGDIFPDLARRFDLGYTALAAANPGVDPWRPGDARRIIVPARFVLPRAPHRGIVVNLAQWRLYYFRPGGSRVETHPVGLGVIGRTTPLGVTRVVRKEPHPTWRPPPDIRAAEHLPAAIPPGPDNPLGDYALHLGWPNYLIHGTNKPDGVGRNVSHGCIRLYPEDIARLFAEVRVGTPVRVVDQPATAGWEGDRLYLQVFPTKRQTEAIDIEQRVKFAPAPVRAVRRVVRRAAGRFARLVDWRRVDRAARARTGIAVVVADRAVEARR
ncbi:MAG: L,D-transpeptidase family protein [Stellaceae bacterium]